MKGGYVIRDVRLYTFKSRKSRLVTKASDYIYSSASNYVSNSGLLKIEKADNISVNVLDNKSFVRYNQY